MNKNLYKYKEEKLYDYILALEDNDLKKIDAIINDNTIINLINTNEILDKPSYIEFLNDKMINGYFEKFNVERLTPYNEENVILIYTIKGYKVVSLININDNKISNIDDYWFKIFD